MIQAIRELNQEIELWKQKYIEADRKSEELPMLEINLRNTQAIVVIKYNYDRMILKIELNRY